MAETENTEDLGLDSLEENDVNDYTSGKKDPELEAIKARVREMDKEAKKLKQLSEVEKQMNLVSPSGMTSSPNMSIEEWKEMEVNSRSVYVGNVDYRATEYELEQHFQHFHGCGSINRVTIVCNKHDGHPMGFAYIEFSDKDSVRMAMAMGDSVFRGRQIQIMPKRSNQLGMSLTNRPPRKRLSGRGSVAYGGGHSYGGRRLRHGKRKKKKKGTK